MNCNTVISQRYEKIVKGTQFQAKIKKVTVENLGNKNAETKT